MIASETMTLEVEDFTGQVRRRARDIPRTATVSDLVESIRSEIDLPDPVTVEGPNGELGFYIVGDGGKTPWRAATRPPSFIHFQVLPRLLEGHNLADLVAVLGSLNIIAAELDR